MIVGIQGLPPLIRKLAFMRDTTVPEFYNIIISLIPLSDFCFFFRLWAPSKSRGPFIILGPQHIAD